MVVHHNVSLCSCSLVGSCPVLPYRSKAKEEYYIIAMMLIILILCLLQIYNLKRGHIEEKYYRPLFTTTEKPRQSDGMPYFYELTDSAMLADYVYYNSMTGDFFGLDINSSQCSSSRV